MASFLKAQKRVMFTDDSHKAERRWTWAVLLSHLTQVYTFSIWRSFLVTYITSIPWGGTVIGKTCQSNTWREKNEALLAKPKAHLLYFWFIVTWLLKLSPLKMMTSVVDRNPIFCALSTFLVCFCFGPFCWIAQCCKRDVKSVRAWKCSEQSEVY